MNEWIGSHTGSRLCYVQGRLLQSAVGRSTKVCYQQVAAGHECCSASCEQWAARRSTTAAWHTCFTLSCIGSMWQMESHTSLGWRCTSACMAMHRIICLSCVHRSLKLLNDSIFVPPAAIYSLFHGFSSIRTAVAPSPSPKQFAWAGHANWLFSSYTEDVSFWSVLGTLSALEALFATMRYINWHLHFIKIVPTRWRILRLKCTKIVFYWGSAPDPVAGAIQRSPKELLLIGG